MQIANVLHQDHPQLDDIETTGIAHLPSDYLSYKIRNYEAEYTAAFLTYEKIDNRDNTHRAEALLDCRKFAWFARHTDTGMVHVISNACHQRWCPICARAKSSMIRDNVHEWSKTIRNLKFLTLTFRHSNKSLKTQVDELYEKFRLYRKKKFLKKHLRGGIWFFEIKRAKKAGGWHPHIHCVIDADYISKEQLSLEWFGTTGHSYIIDIRKVRSLKDVSEYVSKYCSKPAKLSDFSPEDQVDIVDAMHGRRLAGTFGTGSRCRLRPVRSEDGTKWQRIATWSNIVSLRRTCTKAEKIIKAFLTNQPISKDDVTDKMFSPFTLSTETRSLGHEGNNKQLIFKGFT